MDYSGLSYDCLRKQAKTGLDRATRHDPACDEEDAAQEGITRFLQLLRTIGPNAVDPRKGTTRQVVGGCVRMVVYEVVGRGRRRKTSELPDDVADPNAINPLEALATDGDAKHAERRRRFLRQWWKNLGERRKVALLRIHGPMFGRSDSKKATKADHTAAFHARERLKVLLAVLEALEAR